MYGILCICSMCEPLTPGSLCLVQSLIDWFTEGEVACRESNIVLETIIDHYTVGNWTLFSGPIHSFRKWRNIQKYTHFNTHPSIICFLCSHTVPEMSLFNNKHVEQWDVSLPNMANLISKFLIQGLYIYIYSVFWHDFISRGSSPDPMPCFQLLPKPPNHLPLF